MLKYCYKKWDQNKDRLEVALRKTDLSRVEYRDLLILTVANILDPDDYSDYSWDAGNCTEINDGDYQGTLLYLIPAKTYQPSEYEYLMTYIGYGSCSGCDLLQAIQPDSHDETTDEDIAEFMALCKDFITNMIKPYNAGWRNNEEFEHITMEEK